MTLEQDRLATELDQLRDEVIAPAAAVEEVESERDKHVGLRESTQRERDAAVAERDAATSRASIAESATLTVEAERGPLSK